MAITLTSTMSDSVQTAYEKDYLLAFAQRKIWANIVWDRMLRKVVGTGGELAGTTVQVPIYEALTTPTASLSQNLDVTPEAWADDAVTVSLAEEGNVVQMTRLLKDIASYVELGAPVAKAIGQNMAERIDRILRDSVVFNASNVLYGGTGTSRVDVNATDDLITYAKIVQAVSMAESMGIAPFDDGTYLTIVHPAIMTEIVGMNEWKNPAYYVNPGPIATGRISEGGSLPGEIGQLYKLRFLPHVYGKLFLGAGAPAQAATTSTLALAAGGTEIIVASETGLAAGTWVTVGTLESSSTAYPTTERVQILSIDTTTHCQIQGRGNAFDNFGLQFAHAADCSVIEAPNVAAIPIMGPESMVVAYADSVGQEGEVAVEWKSTDLPKRFVNHSWYWVGGASIVDKNVVMIEAATAGEMYGSN